ncbi:hypothetical protein P3T20_005313 [Paraburkholderia sp. GAS206C]|jgi:hypothetical protein|uniref:Uncharacterized protein n=1 Tax=Paraburkholderia phenazinium TaxID=60549 RepID=A0A1N6FVL4_9BURK|nr:hypothetical protein SAMN05444168_1904 [Paraburkholderia phenazinium]
MSSRSERSELFESQPPGKRLAAAPRARLHTFGRAALAASLCACVSVTLSACSNDDDKAPETATTTSDQVNSAPPAPYAMPQNVATQAAPAAAAGLPPNAFQTPPPTAAQVGAAASDSLVTPVIHTVD